jgi:hypothetical protein
MKIRPVLLAMAGVGAALAGAISTGCSASDSVDCRIAPNGICVDGGADGDADGGDVCPAIGPNGLVDFPQVCETCMKDQCCAQTVACLGDVGEAGSDTCSDLLDCEQRCYTITDLKSAGLCESACETSHPSSLPAFMAYQQCVGTCC